MRFYSSVFLLLCILLFLKPVEAFSPSRPLRSNKDHRGLEYNVVALTRCLGENDKLAGMLTERSVNCIYLPCIRFEAGAQKSQLREELSRHDLTVLTSPQAASVFIDALIRSKPLSRSDSSSNIIALGHGTASILRRHHIEPLFSPSAPSAARLVEELPTHWGMRILYPTSALSSDELQFGLQNRGFKVLRLNTYTTVEAEPWSTQLLALAQAIRVVAFASPSAMKVWARRVPPHDRVFALAMGHTTAKAATAAGFAHVACPPSPGGLAVFADFIREQAASSKQGMTTT